LFKVPLSASKYLLISNLKKQFFNLYSYQEFHEDEELARAIALSLEMFNRPKSAGKIFNVQPEEKEEGS